MKHRTGASQWSRRRPTVNPAFAISRPARRRTMQVGVVPTRRLPPAQDPEGGAVFRGKMRRKVAPDRAHSLASARSFDLVSGPNGRARGAPGRTFLGGTSMIKRILAASAALAM